MQDWLLWAQLSHTQANNVQGIIKSVRFPHWASYTCLHSGKGEVRSLPRNKSIGLCEKPKTICTKLCGQGFPLPPAVYRVSFPTSSLSHVEGSRARLNSQLRDKRESGTRGFQGPLLHSAFKDKPLNDVILNTPMCRSPWCLGHCEILHTLVPADLHLQRPEQVCPSMVILLPSISQSQRPFPTHISVSCEASAFFVSYFLSTNLSSFLLAWGRKLRSGKKKVFLTSTGYLVRVWQPQGLFPPSWHLRKGLQLTFLLVHFFHEAQRGII